MRGANQLGAGYRTQALQSVAGDEGLSSDVRAAAERQLVDLAHAEAQARIGEVQAALEAEIAAQQKVRCADQEATAAARAAAKAEVSRLSAARDRVPADFQASADAGASSAGNDELRSLTQERLRGMEELATSTKARAAIERQLLDLEQQARDAQVKALIAQIQASNLPDKDARIEALTSAQGSVNAAENKALDRKSEGPAASYTRGLNQTPDQIDDSLQSAAVDGLKSFNDGLVQSITNAKNLGDVFRDVANQIIGDLARIGIEQEITRPLANAIFGGPGQTGTGLFGTLFGLGSSGPGRRGGRQLPLRPADYAAAAGGRWPGQRRRRLPHQRVRPGAVRPRGQGQHGLGQHRAEHEPAVDRRCRRRGDCRPAADLQRPGGGDDRRAAGPGQRLRRARRGVGRWGAPTPKRAPTRGAPRASSATAWPATEVVDIVTMPTCPVPSDATLSLVEFATDLQGPLGGPTQRILRLGDRMACELTYGPMRYDDARPFLARLIRAAGSPLAVRFPQRGFSPVLPGRARGRRLHPQRGRRAEGQGRQRPTSSSWKASSSTSQAAADAGSTRFRRTPRWTTLAPPPCRSTRSCACRRPPETPWSSSAR